MNTKHTPGPWLVEFFEDSARIRQEKGYEHTITVVSTWGDSQRETDARLIAAAPELLIALDDFAAISGGGYGDPILTDLDGNQAILVYKDPR